MSSIATVMLVDMVKEAGGRKLAVLAAGTVLWLLACSSREAGLQLRVGVAIAPRVGSRCHWQY
jgi:hypothetical protein